VDLIQAEGDVLDGRVAWFENRLRDGGEWLPHPIKAPGHKQDFHSLCVADFDNDGDLDIFTGGGPLTQGEHVWFLWENGDGRGGEWVEHVVQRGLETHESVSADVDGDGDVDVLTKPWRGICTCGWRTCGSRGGEGMNTKGAKREGERRGRLVDGGRFSKVQGFAVRGGAGMA
jgi:hypothetical protein